MPRQPGWRWRGLSGSDLLGDGGVDGRLLGLLIELRLHVGHLLLLRCVLLRVSLLGGLLVLGMTDHRGGGAGNDGGARHRSDESRASSASSWHVHVSLCCCSMGVG